MTKIENASPASPSLENVKATPSAGVEAVRDIIKRHIKVDATGLAPAVIGHYIFGFEEAAREIIASLTPAPAPVEVGGEAVAWLQEMFGELRMSREQWKDQGAFPVYHRATPSPAGDARGSEKGAARETIARIIDPHSFVPYQPTGAADDAVFADMVKSSLDDAYRKADRIRAALSDAHQKPLTQEEGVKEGFVLVPEEPSDGLLMSMVIRRDHGLGVPGYYDMLGDGEHANRLRVALTEARQAYEEVVGSGFYSAEREAEYAKLRASLATDAEGR